MRRVLPLALLGLTACSFTFDGGAPDFPLVGMPPSLGSLQKFNNGPVYSSAIVRGKDAAYWLSLQEEPKKLRVLRLTAPNDELTLEGDQFLIRWRAFFIWMQGEAPADPAQPRPATLRILSAGDPAPPVEFAFPLGMGQLIIGGAEEVFAYAGPNVSTLPAGSATYEIIRKDGSFRRTIGFAGPGAPSLNGTFYNGDGEIFFDRSGCQEGCMTDANDADLMGLERRSVVGHSTLAELDYDLGLQPRRIFLYEPSRTRRQFITCGSNGLRVLPIVPGEQNPALVLDEAACASELFSLLRIEQPDKSTKLQLYYMIGRELRTVPIDGSRPPERALDREVERVLGIYGNGLVLYSQDPEDRYIYGVGDAWFGDWRFGDRARLIYLSRDREHVRFLENSARSGGIGDLQSAPIGGEVTQLARNVFQYDELADGRLLAASNHAFRGTQNRIVIIDEPRGEARWVVDQASRYGFIPESNDLIVDIVTGASTSDLVRVPIPPKEE